jgi:peroxiredoxin Q/BCP
MLVLFGLTPVAAEEVYKVGDTVPEFKLPYATVDTIAFEGLGSKDLLGQRYVLAFYPADWSGGCTKEVCSFRDAIQVFEDLGVEVLPISTDLVFSHHEWAKHHELNFKLLADHTREFGTGMGVYMPDYGMYSRSVFVVSPEGLFEYIDYEYSVSDDEDFDLLKEALAELKE